MSCRVSTEDRYLCNIFFKFIVLCIQTKIRTMHRFFSNAVFKHGTFRVINIRICINLEWTLIILSMLLV